ncbi:unnamed protein product [Prorocentrum cordatum]|uniref:J domain-containing protein n=2 Tax=Prorocentrum cordatum TaxID=2364126 RepID=A0ABN9Y5J4_9DINO|nr:unnamed protein product [Polarella glacialis]
MAVAALPDLYGLLQVTPRATAAEVRSAYRFLLLVCAFETLSDEARRARYDRKRKRQAEGAEEAVAAPGRRRHRGAGAGQAARPPAEGAGVGAQRCGMDDGGDETFAASQGCARRLRAALQRLRTAIRLVPGEHRQAAIEALQAEVKRSLLSFMEAQRSRGAHSSEIAPGRAELDSASESESDGSLACATGKAIGDWRSPSEAPAPGELTGRHSGERAPGGAPAAAPGAAPGRPIRRSDTQGIEKLARGGAWMYRARVMFAHLCFYTRFQGRLEDAVEHHILLVEIRQMAQEGRGELAADPESGERIHRAFRTVLASAGTSTKDIGLKVHVRLGIFGHKRQVTINSPVLPLPEALSLRSRLLIARSQSWGHFRNAWVDMIRSSRFLRGRMRTCRDAEAFVDSVGAVFEPLWGNLRGLKGRDWGTNQLLLERVHRAAASVQRALASRAALLLRERRSARLRSLRASRRLRAERARWLRRKAGRDMTMGDLAEAIQRAKHGTGTEPGQADPGPRIGVCVYVRSPGFLPPSRRRRAPPPSSCMVAEFAFVHEPQSHRQRSDPA